MAKSTENTNDIQPITREEWIELPRGLVDRHRNDPSDWHLEDKTEWYLPKEATNG